MLQDSSSRWMLLICLFIALVLAVVGFGTPNWYKVLVANQISFTAGFFDACVQSTCFTYLKYLNLDHYSGDHAGCIVFHVFGIILTAVAVLLLTCVVFKCDDDFVGLGCYSLQRRYMYIIVLTLLAGICLLVTVVWFYVAFIRDGLGRGNLPGTLDLRVDYSFGLTAAAASLLIVIGLLLIFCRYQQYDYERPYKPRPKMVLEPVYRPSTPEPVRVVQYEKPVYSRTITPEPVTYRVEPPKSHYTIERPAPVRISSSYRPPSPKTYRYTTAEEPAYASRSTYIERRY